MKRVMYEHMFHEQMYMNEFPIDFHIHMGPFKTEHIHGYWEIMIVTNNECVNCINGQRSVLKKNDIQIIRPKDSHKILQNGDKVHTHINIEVREKVFRDIIGACYSDTFYDELLEKPKLGSYTFDEADFEYINKILHRVQLCGSDFKKWEKYLRQIVSHIVLTAIDQKNLLLIQSSDESDETISKSAIIVKRALSLMRKKENFEKNITEICTMLDISEKHLGRLFKEQGRQTPGKEFRSIKLDYACGLFLTTNMSVNDVMDEIHILDLGHFNKIFREKYGITPGEFKSQHKTKR